MPPATSSPQPLLRVQQLSKRYGALTALQDASFELWPGEVLAVVGESGSGKSTLLNTVAAQMRPDSGCVEFRLRDGSLADVHALSAARQRLLARTDWGFVHQNPADGLRMDVSAGFWCTKPQSVRANRRWRAALRAVSYTHLTLPTNREV